jgi:predicted metal-dependent hydrolase
MGLPNDSSIRISLPPDCSESTIEHFLAQLPVALAVVTE